MSNNFETLEGFALSKDRTAFLDRLVKGSDDHFFFTLLHLLHRNTDGKLTQEVFNLLEQYEKSGVADSTRLNNLKTRARLQSVDHGDEATKKKVLDWLVQELRVSFAASAELPPSAEKEEGEKEGTKYPTKLDLSSIAAFGRVRNLSEYRPSAYPRLLKKSGLIPTTENDKLLAKLNEADLEGVMELIKVDFEDTTIKRTFGQLGVHRQLTLEQLDELLRFKPGFIDQTEFVLAYIARLAPHESVNIATDLEAREEYLNRVWKFVVGLSGGFNSFKVNVLYHQLSLERSRGVFNEERFMEYLSIPRYSSYTNRDWVSHQSFHASFGQSVGLLESVSNDEELVRDFLSHFFQEKERVEIKPFQHYLDEQFLTRLLAETKLISGADNTEKWVALLGGPDAAEQVKRRVEIKFASTNPKFIATIEEEVKLDVDIKNVSTLIVKVFEIDTTAYYRIRKADIPDDISLDGLVAKTETIHKYDDAPILKVRRSFSFPELNKRGVFVIELIGNGQSSRAVIHKGQLNFVETIGLQGHTFKILDEKHNILSDAELWLDGHLYHPDKSGDILIPFTNSPTNQFIILSAGGFSSHHRFAHRNESYRLVAAFYVDRESLLRLERAKVAVRASLFLSGVPIAINRMEEVTLEITATDQDGTSTTKKADSFVLKEGEESLFEFLVPDNVRSFTFNLVGKVRPFSAAPGAEPTHLSHSQSFSLNNIDSSPLLEDLHLSFSDKGYRIHVMGKTGESKGHRMVPLSFQNRYLSNAIQVTLQSDKDGLIELGPLEEITSITSVGVAGKLAKKTWNLREDSNTQPSRIHVRRGQTLRVASPFSTLDREKVSFIQQSREGGILHDRFDQLSLQEGYLVLGKDVLPVGNFVLRFRETGTTVSIRVVDGSSVALGTGERVLCGDQAIEVREQSPLQVSAVAVGEDEVKVRVSGGHQGAVRVHVLCSSLHPEYDAYSLLVGGHRPADLSSSQLASVRRRIQLLENRAISEEYRYILERKYAQKRAGNMLTQPTLLLQPRIAVTKQVHSDDDDSDKCLSKSKRRSMGDKKEKCEEREMRSRAAHGYLCADEAEGIMFDRADAAARTTIREYQPNIDFLPSASTTLFNLHPDKDGLVTLSRRKHSLIGTQLRILAVDGESVAFKNVPLSIIPDASPILNHKDLRLGKQAFEPSRHFTEQRRISLLQPGEKFGIGDLATAKFEIYDSLSKVFNLLLTLSGNNSVVQKFQFLLRWEKLSLEERLEQYGKFSSHELNFFVYKKDRKFFDEIIVPFLRNKKEKTFLDHWFLGEDLSGYLSPFKFGGLNMFEKILLGERTNRSGDIAKLLAGQFAEMPKNPNKFNHIFNTALAARGLDAESQEGGGGLGQQQLLGGLVPDSAGGGYAPQRQFYQVLGATKQWGETNYYQLQKEDQNASLIQLNGFWSDFAQHVDSGKGKVFVSKHVGEATSNYTEILLALSVLDLPSTQAAHKSHYGEGRMDMEAGSAAVVFHKEVLESAISNTVGGVLVSQHYWDPSDATFINEEGEEVDKYITGEFLPSKEYGCQITLTNVAKSRAKVDVLMQIPVGSIPLNNGFFTQGKFVELPPNSTRVLQYYFYFPEASATPLPHFPVQVSKNEAVVAFTQATTLNVVTKLSGVDTKSWNYVSQQAPEEEFLSFLATQNILSAKVNLNQIKWRLKDATTFKKVVAILRERLVYHQGVWSFSLLHGDVEGVREFLRHEGAIVERCRPLFHSSLLDVDWEEAYEHLEYSPLVNERAHRKKQQHGGVDIDNPQLKQQYKLFLEVLTFKPSLDSLDLMALTYYLLLQDRVDEALTVFAEIPHGEEKGKEKEGRTGLDSPHALIQYDYLQAYLDFFSEKPSVAQEIALKYADYPVPSWNKRFKEILQQIDEMKGGEVKVQDKESRSQMMSHLAATEASFDFTIEGKSIHLTYSNLSEVTISFFDMDVEVLFSSSPFGLGQLDQFSFVRANKTMKVELPSNERRHSVELPKEQQTGNAMVRVSGGAIHKSVPHFAHSLSVLMMENYGQLSVTHSVTGSPISRAYVKVYGKDRSSSVAFYKDGYTDLRGRFDYVSLNSDRLQSIERFSILVLTENDGAVIKEAFPPKV